MDSSYAQKLEPTFEYYRANTIRYDSRALCVHTAKRLQTYETCVTSTTERFHDGVLLYWELGWFEEGAQGCSVVP